jgi:lipid-A-disaccharide synthase
VLAGKFLVPELLQHDATPEKISEAVGQLLNDPAHLKEIKNEFTEIHKSLRQDSAEKAAEVILSYL